MSRYLEFEDCEPDTNGVHRTKRKTLGRVPTLADLARHYQLGCIPPRSKVTVPNVYAGIGGLLAGAMGFRKF